MQAVLLWTNVNTAGNASLVVPVRCQLEWLGEGLNGSETWCRGAGTAELMKRLAYFNCLFRQDSRRFGFVVAFLLIRHKFIQ